MLFVAFITLSICKAKASDSCEILFNKHLIFKGSVEQENPVAFIKAKHFKNTDCLTIRYRSENANKGWTRTFYINDSNGQNLKTIDLGKQSGSVTVNASVLNELEKKKQPFFIYTISLPKDKAMAARIRVRRMLICKIEWN